jgi:Ca2+-binding RTX toxin-like protein
MHPGLDLVALAERLKAQGRTYQINISLVASDTGPDVVRSVPANGLDVFSLWFTGNDESEIVSGGNLTDVIYGENGNDTIYGLGGGDVLSGGLHDDVLHGGLGNDTLYDNYGSNELYGEEGNDRLSVGNFLTAGTVVDGGSGDDYLDLSMTNNYSDIVIDLTRYESITGGITVRSIEAMTLQTSRGNDRITGGGERDWINVGRGDDIVHGGGGDDFLLGEIGSDYLYGDDGDDSLFGGKDEDHLYGGSGTNLLRGGLHNDTYHVESATDLVIEDFGGGTRDVVMAGVDSFTLPDLVEILTYTGSGSFSGTGNALANTITGGRGNDVLRGEAGSDILVGGAGKDMLTGGDGADRFIFATADSYSGGGARDVITDFTSGEDKIDLSALSISDEASQITFKGVGSGLIVYVDTNLNGFDYSDFAIQLAGVQSVQVSDFIL